MSVLIGTHQAQQERESRGFVWLWPGQPPTNPAVNPTYPPGTVIQGRYEPLDHPQSRFFPGRQGPNVAAEGQVRDQIYVRQELPDHPASRFGAGVQGPDFGALPPRIGTLIVGQYVPLDHPKSLFVSPPPPIRGTKLPITDFFIGRQELPDHPRSNFWLGVQGPNVAPPPLVGGVFIGQALPLDHPRSTFAAGIQGPNVRPPIRDGIIVTQELPDYPRHPRSFFYPGRQGPNVEPPSLANRQLFVPQEQPWHPASFLLTAPPPIPLKPPQFYLIVKQEAPFHPGSFFFAGHTPVDYEERQFFIIV